MKEQIEKRLVELNKNRQQTLEEIARAKGMINRLETMVIRTEGAIQERAEELEKLNNKDEIIEEGEEKE